MPGDPVGSCILDHPANELTWGEILRFPRVLVSDGKPAPRCDPCDHEDPRISVIKPARQALVRR